jgi:tetratricopeptide (TPR) repeat protein
LELGPNLAEAHLAFARHLFYCYRDNAQARVQLAIAKHGLPNNVDAILLEAYMDRRQGNWEKAIEEFNEVIARDPRFALVNRDWPLAKQLLEKMKGREDEGYFAYVSEPVPIGCYAILLARLQGGNAGADSRFTKVREQLSEKVQKAPEDAGLLSQLAVVDALLNVKEAAIAEAKHAIEMLPISKDALAGAGLVTNLAVVYAWTDELDLAFATLEHAAKPRHVFRMAN